MTAWLCLLLAGVLEILWGAWTEAIGWLHAAVAQHWNLGGDRLEHRADGRGAQNGPVRNGLCHLDRDRRGRHGYPRHLHVGEPADAARLMCIGLIVAGIVGLKLVTQ
jgi:hypothetical protein